MLSLNFRCFDKVISSKASRTPPPNRILGSNTWQASTRRIRLPQSGAFVGRSLLIVTFSPKRILSKDATGDVGIIVFIIIVAHTLNFSVEHRQPTITMRGESGIQVFSLYSRPSPVTDRNMW
jgi:hypothetical protein